MMKIYLVGGAVRDKLLGRTPKDFDYIVVGSNHEEMVHKGFLPVGKSHSVYLHPDTREEYTLASTLEDDLQRRDLTINAMAMEGEKLVDLFGGYNDLRNKVLKHVREENFFIDPLRVYRVARFKSEFFDFHISADTLKLMKKASSLDAFKNVSPERILNEVIKVLSVDHPSAFFKILRDESILHLHFTELNDLDGSAWQHTMKLLDLSGSQKDPLTAYASLFVDMQDNNAATLSKRLLVSNEWYRASVNVLLYYQKLKNLSECSPEMVVDFLYSMDAFRKEFMVDILANLLTLDGNMKEGQLLQNAFQTIKKVSVGDISENLSGKLLGDAIKIERVKRLASSHLI